MDQIFKECVNISRFLESIAVEDEDGEVEGLQMCIRDIDDPQRLVHIVRFRCKTTEELEFHIAELKLGNPYKRLLVKDEVMVQELFDFFLLLQMISYNTPGAVMVSRELLGIIDETMGGIKNWGGEGEGGIMGDEEDSECEAKSTSEDEEDEPPKRKKRKCTKKKEKKTFKRVRREKSASDGDENSDDSL